MLNFNESFSISFCFPILSRNIKKIGSRFGVEIEVEIASDWMSVVNDRLIARYVEWN